MNGMDVAHRREVLDELRREIDYARTTIPLTREALILAADRAARRFAGNIVDLPKFIAENPGMLQIKAPETSRTSGLTIAGTMRRDALCWILKNSDDIVDAVHVGQFEGRRWALMKELADLALGLLENREDLAGEYPVEAARRQLDSLELVEWPDRDALANLLQGVNAQLEDILVYSGENPILRGDHPDLPATSTVFEAIWDILDLNDRDPGAFYGCLRNEAAHVGDAPAPR